VASGDKVVFLADAPVSIPNEKLTKLAVHPQQDSEHVSEKDGSIVFNTHGWYEVLLLVEWDQSNTEGTRFSHTQIPDQEPLHSEAIDASVLARISQGKQKLRGNSLFGPDRTTSLVLEVWQDSGEPVTVNHAELAVRELKTPWDPEA
jgi:hypothetical protein